MRENNTYKDHHHLLAVTMEITYDKDADALYIEFRKGAFAKNRKIDDLTIIDLDSRGNMLGIEILDARKRIPAASLTKVHVKNMLAAE